MISLSPATLALPLDGEALMVLVDSLPSNVYFRSVRLSPCGPFEWVLVTISVAVCWMERSITSGAGAGPNSLLATFSFHSPLKLVAASAWVENATIDRRDTAKIFCMEGPRRLTTQSISGGSVKHCKGGTSAPGDRLPTRAAAP